jgi:cytochrome c5
MITRHHFALVALIAILPQAGCNSQAPSAPSPVNQGDSHPSFFKAAPAKGGAQLWAENCTRCHYIRPPDAFSAAQWGLLMHHMRSRADLTGGEEREILRFLRAGSGMDAE